MPPISSDGAAPTADSSPPTARRSNGCTPTHARSPRSPAMQISEAMAQTVRDRFYPKTMLQLDQIAGIDELMRDAVSFKYIPQPLGPAQLDQLLQLPTRP